MSGLSLPVSRPTGQAILVAGSNSRAKPVQILRELGFGSTEVDDPYAAMAELCRRPLVYRAMILNLAGLYREELAIIPAVKNRFPHVELWLAHTDGRQAALAEAMRLGADGLLAEDGLHRVAASATRVQPAPVPVASVPVASVPEASVPAWTDPVPLDVSRVSDTLDRSSLDRSAVDDPAVDDLAVLGVNDPAAETSGPLLTPEELRALLQEQPTAHQEDE